MAPSKPLPTTPPQTRRQSGSIKRSATLQSTRKQPAPPHYPTNTNSSSNTSSNINTDQKSHKQHSQFQSQSHTPTYADRPSRSSEMPFRPGVPDRQNSVQTRYISMLLALDTIPRMHNILISFFTWLLLAGFILFPGTFTSLSTSLSKDSESGIIGADAASQILHSVKNIELLIIGSVCCGIGAGGMLWLWFRWQENYVWLLNRIFLPGCLNSLAGLISTLINVYSQQGGKWSITARVTAIVTGSIMIICGFLFGLYNFWILEKVRRKHGVEWGVHSSRQQEEGGKEDEGLAEKIVRVAHAPALEPGSVV